MKRTLSAALAILMLVGTFVISVPFTASAAKYSGSGSGTVASEEATKAVEDAVPYTELPTGGWVTPSKNLSYDQFVDVYQKLKDAGLNYMVTVDESTSDWHSAKALSAANEVGMDIFLNPTYTHFDFDYTYERLEKFSHYPNVRGIWFGDEPGEGTQMDNFISSSNELMRRFGRDDLLYGANLLPNYASIDRYEDYVSSYVAGTQKYDGGKKVENRSTDFISFDFYPFAGATGDAVPRLVQNLYQVKKVADANGVEMYSYLQSSGWSGMREPNATELLYDMHMNLATGVKGVTYYVAFQTGAYTPMINANGSIGSTYYKVQSVNENVEGMKGVYLDFENEGFVSVGSSETVNLVKALNPSYVKTSYKELKSVSAQKAFVGCFTKGSGATSQTGLYVVNQDYTSKSNQSITLTFTGSKNYQVWGADGLEQMGADSKLTLSVKPGDGKFVIVNSVNDASGYEAVIPEVVDNTNYTHMNGLLFDLEYDNNGKITNGKKNGIGIINGDTARLEDVNGEKVLSRYDFKLDYVMGMHSAAGVTVELDIMFTGSGNDKVFFDNTTNFNFYRFEESGDIYFGLPDYASDVHKGGLNSQTMANYFPKNEWLHVILAQSKDGQAIYVNGKKVLSDKLGYDALGMSSLEFVSDGSVKLRDAKVYTYAVDATEVKYMSNDRNGIDNNILGAFNDLADGAWYTAALESMVRRGFVQGVTPTALAPDNNITRAQFVSILSRMAVADLDDYKFASLPFGDVIKGQWHYKAIAWAYENGLVDGVTPTSFNPDGNITREQMAVLIVRFASKFGYDLTPTVAEASFDDQASIGGWALESVKLCQTTGLVTGINGSFVPAGTATRAQAAQIFVRMLNL